MDLRHCLLQSLGVEHGFGTRLRENDPQGRPETVTLSQVHKSVVVSEMECRPGQSRPWGDGLCSGPGGRKIGVWTADCLPVLLASPSGHHVAALHAGWRGAAAGIVREGLRILCGEAGVLPGEVLVVMGPCIGPCCYDVGPEVWSAVWEGTPGYCPESQLRLDLRGLVAFQLREAGVPVENIGSLALCTRCHPDLFFSHRGMGADRKGRSMLNYICPRS
ncbi:MAG: polyphenol oxidase family protein [Leptospirillia bacterium]